MNIPFFLNSKSFGVVILFVLFTAVFLLLSCGNKRLELQMQAKQAIAKDIKGLTKSGIDGASAGIGSFIMDMAMSKKEQDSLLLKPVMPYIDEALNTKSEEELQAICTSSKERFKLIGTIMVQNKDAIAASVGEKYSAAKSLVDFLIKFIDENKGVLEKMNSGS